MADYKEIITGKLNEYMIAVKGAVESMPETERVREVYSKGLSRTKAYGRMAKTAFDINADTKEMDRVFAEIGRLYFEENRGKADGFYAPLFQQLEALSAGIRAKQEEIELMKADVDASANDLDVEITNFEDIVNATESEGAGTDEKTEQ